MANKKAGIFVRLDEETETAVVDLVDSKSITKSGAIRLIIREWAQMKRQTVTVPVEGTITGDKVVFSNPEYEAYLKSPLDPRN